MQIYDQKQNDVQKLRARFVILFRIQVPDDSVDSEKAAELKESLELRVDHALLSYVFVREVFQRQACNEVNDKWAFELVDSYHFWIEYFFSELVHECRAEADYDVEDEYDVDNYCEYVVLLGFEGDGLEGQVEWDWETIKNNAQNNQNVPSLFVFLRAWNQASLKYRLLVRIRCSY